MSLVIGENLIVSMHYKLTDNDGNEIDSSEGSDPLIYLHGKGNIIAGLEKPLNGKAEGDTLQVTVEPAEGYGEVLDEMVQVVARSEFDGIDEIEVGMTFEAQGPDGSMQSIEIMKVEGDDITIDANHPLAGVTLNFDVEIVSIREATQEEIDHGHAH
ncbi:MAG: peptidylprolyl isomerase [Planctomycetaceae bacterium]|nr:peptidylprolyl isomerase [Planctomycetaceae bacterium]